MRKLLSGLLLTVLFFSSCSKSEVNPIVQEKPVRIELSMKGDYKNYQLFFGIHNMAKASGEFVLPIITQPTTAKWTQVIDQGNAYNYIEDLDFDKMVVESKDGISTLGFLLSAVQTNESPENINLLEIEVRLYVNDVLKKTFDYKTKPLGEVLLPLTENIEISKL